MTESEQMAVAVIDHDAASARMYTSLYEAVMRRGRKVRGARAVGLLIAATAARHGMAVYTSNPDDLAGLDAMVVVVPIA